MTQAVVQWWSAPACQSDAVALGALPHVQRLSITESRGGSEGGTLVTVADDLLAIGAAAGHVVRVSVPGRGLTEWLVSRIEDSDGDMAVVSLAPIRQVLALRGLVREETSTGLTVAFTPRPLTVSEILTQFVLSNTTTDGLSWLSVGTVEYTGRLTLPAFAGYTRAQLLTAIERATGYDVVLRRIGTTGYAIDLLEDVGASQPTVLIEAPVSARRIQRTRSVDESETVLIPMADNKTVMGEVAWIGAAPIGVGPFWVPLTAPNGGLPPIVEDGQFVGAYAVFGGTNVQQILASRASDSAIQVTATPGHSADAAVVLWATAEGRPITEVVSPSAIAARGRVASRLVVPTMRQERNFVQNPGFAQGLSSWSDFSSSGPAAYDTEDFGITLTGTVATTRSAGTATTTPLSVAGLPASRWIRRGMQLVVNGQTYTITSDAIPSTSGTLSVSVSPALVSPIADNTSIAIQRVEERALTLASGQSLGSPLLVCTDSNTDNLVDIPGTLTYAATPALTSSNATPRYLNDVLAETCILDVSVNGAASSDPFYGLTTMVSGTALSTPSRDGVSDRWFFGEDPASLGLVTGAWVMMPLRHVVPEIWPGSRPCWLYEVTGTTTVQGLTYVVLAPDTLGGLVTPALAHTGTQSGTWLLYGTTKYTPATTTTFQLRRETRTLLADGTQSAGATSVSFKANATIARRDWLSSDTLTVERRITNAVMAYTAVSVQAGGPGSIISATLNTSTSTIDDLPSSDYTGANEGLAVFNLNTDPTGQATPAWLVSVSSGVATLHSTFTPSTISVRMGSSGTRTATWSAYYDHTLSAGASWGTNGRAALSISAVPTGVSYARGSRVWSSWHSRADHGRDTCLRLYASVSSGATSCTVLGTDRYRSTDDPTASRPIGLYRVPGTSTTFAISGETLDVATSVQASGSGTASVTLRAANSTALASGTAFRITTPALLPIPGRTSGPAVRLFAPSGSVSAPALASTSFRVPVPTGTTVPLIAKAWFVVGAGTLTAADGPALAIIDTVANTRLALGQLSQTTTFTATPSVVEITATLTLSSSSTLALRLYGGSATDFAKWHVATEALVAIGTDEDVPFFEHSGSLLAWQRAAAILPARVAGARYRIDHADVSALSLSDATLSLGQHVRLRDARLGLDTEQRIVRLTWLWPNLETVDLECGALTPRFTDVEAT